MISVHASSAVNRELQKDYEIGICCFYTKHEKTLSKDWLAQNYDNVSEWSDLCIVDFCFSELALRKFN
jgi:hypothetical protein